MQIEKLEETLLIISFKQEDSKSAETAFIELYQTYSKFLSSVIKKGLKKMGIYDEHLFQATMNNAFFKIYSNPLSFSIPEGAKNDNCFKAWISVVASNELKTLLKDYFTKESDLSIIDEELIQENESINSDIADSLNIKMLNDALDTLNDRDREILLTLYNYHEDGKNTPSYVLDAICKLHNTTKPNIRKIKERSEKKIVEYFSKLSQLKPLKHVK